MEVGRLGPSDYFGEWLSDRKVIIVAVVVVVITITTLAESTRLIAFLFLIFHRSKWFCGQPWKPQIQQRHVCRLGP